MFSTCTEGRTVNELPVSYTNVKPSTVAFASNTIPAVNNLTDLMKQLPQQVQLRDENKWLQLIVESVATNAWSENASWAA
jgi:hypothetical protein